MRCTSPTHEIGPLYAYACAFKPFAPAPPLLSCVQKIEVARNDVRWLCSLASPCDWTGDGWNSFGKFLPVWKRSRRFQTPFKRRWLFRINHPEFHISILWNRLQDGLREFHALQLLRLQIVLKENTSISYRSVYIIRRMLGWGCKLDAGPLSPGHFTINIQAHPLTQYS